MVAGRQETGEVAEIYLDLQVENKGGTGNCIYFWLLAFCFSFCFVLFVLT